ncbi:uncharacterized protein LOC144475207 isoform X3 [Augochlora pura]
MARVCVYERSVTSILTDVSFYKNLNPATIGLHIKQELIFDTDNNCQDNNLPLMDTDVDIVEIIDQGTQPLDNVNNKENELVLSMDRVDAYLSSRTGKRKRLASEKDVCVSSKSPKIIETTTEGFLNFNPSKTFKIHTDYLCNKFHTVCEPPHSVDDRKRLCTCKKGTRSSTSFLCSFCKAQHAEKLDLDCQVYHKHNRSSPCSTEIFEDHNESNKPRKDRKIRKTNETSASDKNSRLSGDNITSTVQQRKNDNTRKVKQTTATEFVIVIDDDDSSKEIDTATEKLAAPDFQEVRRRIVTRRNAAKNTEKVDLYRKTLKKQIRQKETVAKSLSPSANKKTLIATESSTPNGNAAEENMTKISSNKNIEIVVEDEPVDFTLQNFNPQDVTTNSFKQLNNDIRIDSNELTRFLKDIKVEIVDKINRITLEKYDSKSATRKMNKQKPKRQLIEEEWRAKCKDCKVILVRCDLAVKIKRNETNAETWREKVNVKRKKSPPEEPFQCSEVLDASQKVTKPNSHSLLRCKVCNDCFSWKKNLRKHFELRHVFFKSCICDAECKTKVELQRHYVNKHGCFKHMWCCVCFKRFSSLAILRQHLVLHCFQVLLPKGKKQRNKGEVKCRMPCKKNSCKACGKRYWLKSCLKEHQKVCAKMLAREKQLQNVSKLGLIDKHSYRTESLSTKRSKTTRHVRDCSGIDKKIPYCTTCGKHFRTFRKLCAHKRIYSKTATHVCGICNTAFSTLTILNHHHRSTHVVDVVQKYKYYCTFCAQGFMIKDNVQIHTTHFHAGQTSFVPKPWLTRGENWKVTKVCRACHLVFDSSEQFIQHNMFYYKGQMFTCTFCNKTFYGMYMLRNHIKLEHDIKKQYTYTCNICSEGFTLESHYYAHKLHVQHTVSNAESTNRPSLKYNCDICHMIFTAKKDLRQHKMEYTDDGDYHCSFCTRKCLTKVILHKHVSLSHTFSNFTDRWKCRYCDEVLSSCTEIEPHEAHFHPKLNGSQDDSSDQIIANQNTEVPGDVAQVFCTICDVKFESWRKLIHHSKEYFTAGSHMCSICNHKFAELHQLEVHKLNHTNLNFVLSEYHCPVCREGFANQVDVRMHTMHFHANTPRETQSALVSNSPLKKELTCPVCMVKFNDSKSMYSHRVRYMNEGSHVCHRCDRKFRSASQLNNHLKKHTLDSAHLKYSCPWCDEKFSTSLSSYQHIVHIHWKNKEGRVTYLKKDDSRAAVGLLHDDDYDTLSDQSFSSTDAEIVHTTSNVQLIQLE